MPRGRTSVRITARAVLGRRAAESLRLEIYRLARQLRIVPTTVRVRRIGGR